MTAAAETTAPRRRKIFPHLENEAKRSEEKAASSGDGGKDDNANDLKPENDAQYDNAKSRRRGKKQQQSSNGISGETSSSSISVHHDHLLPLPLVLTVLVCSGLFWIASFRDVMATGKPILDTLGVLWGQDDADANFLRYTKSTAWFDDSRGWKSKQGGLSTILAATTDANDMGGLFVRKLAGAAGLAFHTTKLLPVVFHSPPYRESTTTSSGKRGGAHRWVGASWSAGHFNPVLALGMIGDACVSAFYLARLEDLKDAGAGGLGAAFALTSLAEAFVLGLYLLSRRMSRGTTAASSASGAGRAGAAGYRIEEDPDSLPSRIVTRTTFIVSTAISLVSLRDLFFPGTILSFVPRDDIYLEWTGAFLHSPPPDTVEADEHGLEAPLFAGDKFVSQLLGLYLSLSCMFKFMAACGWSKGNRSMGGGKAENVDRSGVVSSKMIWKAQAFGDFLILGLLRLFAPAAKTASLDLRWHLMLVAYEAFILFLYGVW